MSTGLPLFDWTPPVLAKRPRRAGPHQVDPRLRLALHLLLAGRHTGRARAATWEQLREELVAEGMEVGITRRLQEAGEELVEAGEPVVGLSSDGVFYAVEADEVEAALREAEKRARKALMRRRFLRRIWKRMLGQRDLGEGQAA